MSNPIILTSGLTPEGDEDGYIPSVSLDHEKDPGPNRDWSLMSVFGSEAEDSPMAGGSHIGAGDTLDECLESATR